MPKLNAITLILIVKFDDALTDANRTANAASFGKLG